MGVKVSVVTVTYNCDTIIESTLLSVIAQSYKNIEYVIIDGGSRDGTLDVLRKYNSYINVLVSEPDNGIYDAMNKAISLCTGDYVIFMNAGDLFTNSKVIETVFSGLNFNYADVIYGSVILDKKTKEIEVKPGDFKEFWKGSRFCHQSAFISLELHKKYPYDLKYKIAADFDFFNKMYLKNKVFNYIDIPFSKVTLGGVSDISRIKLINEVLAISKSKKLSVYLHFFIEGLKAIILSRGRILTHYLFKK